MRTPPAAGGGAGEGTRTPDPIITNDVLYQLSYTGILPGGGPTPPQDAAQAGSPGATACRHAADARGIRVTGWPTYPEGCAAPGPGDRLPPQPADVR